MKDLIIIGAGDFGREVAALVERINQINPEWLIKGFLDDDQKLHGRIVDGYPVLGGREWLSSCSGDLHLICAIGNSSVRKKTIELIPSGERIHYATLIDPAAILMRDAVLGEGTIVCAGTVISIGTHLGKHSIINLNCTIGHDVNAEDFLTVHPGSNISGRVSLGEACFLGTGVKMIPGLRVAPETVIGAGAVVIRDINDPGTYAGVPARRIKEK